MKPDDFLDPNNFDKITPDMYDELNQQIEDIWDVLKWLGICRP